MLYSNEQINQCQPHPDEWRVPERLPQHQDRVWFASDAWTKPGPVYFGYTLSADNSIFCVRLNWKKIYYIIKNCSSSLNIFTVRGCPRNWLNQINAHMMIHLQFLNYDRVILRPLIVVKANWSKENVPDSWWPIEIQNYLLSIRMEMP